MLITKEQIQSYHDNGYLVVENVLDAATIDRIRQVIAGLVAKAAGVTAHNDVYDLEPTHTPENPRVRRIKT
ncbi:MAG: phytanoyl-CoA dioxygenase family protein, partial [Burkholderiales bacterium]